MNEVTQKPNVSTELARERSRQAADRTLMAWVRTALAQISFGFTIYKFLQAAEADLGHPLLRPHGPRRLGLALIGLGTASMILGAVEYFGTLRRLSKISERGYRAFNFTFIVGVVVGLLGLFLFVTILTRTEVV